MKEQQVLTRREFVWMAGALGLAGLGGCRSPFGRADAAYSVAILGDTHYDADPESVYHAHYDESNKYAKIQHAEFRRNAEMWRTRCPKMVAASGRLAHEKSTDFVLQLGDIIQGDCDHVPTHQKMLADCIAALRKPYPADLPFLMVVGNHDFRGKGAWEAYFQFAERHLAEQIGQKVAYPAFSFRHGEDLWVFCNFETHDLMAIVRLIEADPAARHVFLVTHGPFSCLGFAANAWRLGGSPKCLAGRTALYETLSRRHAVVLSGHTHTISWYRYQNKLGGFSEMTCNSCWSADDRATAKPVYEGPAQYGVVPDPKASEKAREAILRETGFFKKDLTDYFHNWGAGHFRLNVGPQEVALDFYPGAAVKPARTFRLK